MAKIDLSDVYIDVSDLELDSDEIENLVREHYEGLDFPTAIEVAMNYCNPVKFVSAMLELMTKNQIEQIISNKAFAMFSFSRDTEKDLLIKYIRKINPEWDWKTDNHYNFNLTTIDAIIKALVGRSNTAKPAEVKE